MSTDPFSDILRFTHAESLVTGGFSAGGPWSLRFPAPEKIKFFAVVKGHCWVQLDGEPQPVRFATGDVGLLSVARGFVLSSDPALPPVDAMEVFSRQGSSVATLGSGEDFAHIGGHVLLDPVSGRLLADALPPWIHIPAVSPHATAFRWLLDQLMAERAHTQPGNSLMCAQLAQMLFIQILRAHLNRPHAEDEPRPAGWLHALADPRIAPAMRKLHAEPEKPWQLDELAELCAMSRTAFAARFRAVAGTTPLAYLSQWRMQLARKALREERAAVAVIGQRLGYASESAFSTAFKRHAGMAPKKYRQHYQDDNIGQAR